MNDQYSWRQTEPITSNEMFLFARAECLTCASTFGTCIGQDRLEFLKREHRRKCEPKRYACGFAHCVECRPEGMDAV